jgi:hypothetical protein
MFQGVSTAMSPDVQRRLAALSLDVIRTVFIVRRPMVEG